MESFVRKFKKEKTDDSTCGIRKGIKYFIDSETGIFISKSGIKLHDKIVEVRINEKEVSDNCDSLEQSFHISKSAGASNSSKSSSGASSNNGESDGNDTDHDFDDQIDTDHDFNDGGEIRKGIKVAEVKRGTYCHGFGLRDDDIIFSVNDRPVKSAAWVFIVVQRMIHSSRASKLRMEIYRKEKGLIVLDNGGNDLFDWDDDDFTRMYSTTSRIKSVNFDAKYLIVKSNGTIALSKFRTPQNEKLFVIRHYAKTILPEEEEEKTLVTLQHKTTGKYLWVDDGKLISVQEPPPEDGRTLPEDSNYLFQLIHPSPSDNTTEIFQPNNDSEHAIGFKNKRSSATLMATTNEKTFFEIFNVQHC